MSIKRFVNDRELWDSFCQEVSAKILSEHIKMEKFPETDDMLRSQGAIRAFREILRLRDDINSRK